MGIMAILIDPVIWAAAFGLGLVTEIFGISHPSSGLGAVVLVALIFAVLIGGFVLTDTLLSVLNAPQSSREADSMIGVLENLSYNMDQATINLMPSMFTGIVAAVLAVIGAKRGLKRPDGVADQQRNEQ